MIELDVGLKACMGPEEYEVSVLIHEEGIHHAVCIMGEEPIRRLRDLCNKALGEKTEPEG